MRIDSVSSLLRGKVSNTMLRLLDVAGIGRSEEAIAAEAQTYWNEGGQGRWMADSHWRGAEPFESGDLWGRIGRRHLEMFQQAAKLLDVSLSPDRVVEWGCGGGANAVQFAPNAQEFIGVDVSAQSLEECARQLAACCDTPFRPVLIDVGQPERALRKIDESCDVFLSFYVFELLPSPAYGERILRIARDLLVPGGLALIQIKYDVGSWRTKPRRWSYRSQAANMTTYPIHTFWELAARCGLEPRYVQLVPADELDERYAYFVLVKPSSVTA
jgi:hypothetical protein